MFLNFGVFINQNLNLQPSPMTSTLVNWQYFHIFLYLHEEKIQKMLLFKIDIYFVR